MSLFRRQRGFSLVEMLVATLVLSFGLLGIAGLQTVSLRNNNNAYLRTQANLLASHIVDSMRANRDAATGEEYDVTLGGSLPTTDPQANADLTVWLVSLGQTLPEGDGAVDCNALTEVCEVTVTWREVGVASLRQIVLSTEI